MVSIKTADGANDETGTTAATAPVIEEGKMDYPSTQPNTTISSLKDGQQLTTTATTTTTISTPATVVTNGGSEEVLYVHDIGVGLKIVSPNAEPFEIQVSSSEIVQELHQVLMEREDTCHRTCFSLQLDGVVLDNFSELKSVPDLKDGCTIKVVEEPYTCREARIHVKHVRDLLKASDWADAYAGTDCASLSFLNLVSGGEVSGKKRVVDCTPPEWIMPNSNSLLLSPVHPNNKEQKPIACLKVLAASGWNPPPGIRKLAGDLM